MRGFGFIFDTRTGVSHQWYSGADGIRRWASNDQPVSDEPPSPEIPADQPHPLTDAERVR